MNRRRRPIVRAGELKATREALGLTTLGLARALEVSEPTVKNWEKAKYAIPPGVEKEVRDLERRTWEYSKRVAALAEHGMVMVYRRTEHMPQGRAADLGAPWWRAVAHGAQRLRPDLAVGYAEELDELTGSRDATLSKAVSPRTLGL